MPVIASIILGMDGLFYLGLGICMICLYHIPFLRQFVMLYPSLFKLLRAVPSTAEEESESLVASPATLTHDLGFRILGYFLILLGLFRSITALHWYDMLYFLGSLNLIPSYIIIIIIFFGSLNLTPNSYFLNQGLWIYLPRIGNLYRRNSHDL